MDALVHVISADSSRDETETAQAHGCTHTELFAEPAGPKILTRTGLRLKTRNGIFFLRPFSSHLQPLSNRSARDHGVLLQKMSMDLNTKRLEYIGLQGACPVRRLLL